RCGPRCGAAPARLEGVSVFPGQTGAHRRSPAGLKEKDMTQEKIYTARNADYENWVTATGNWFPGERIVLNGVDMIADMTGKRSMQVIWLAITGRVPDPRTAEFLDAILALSGCIPDPRLWNNRIAALAGTTRSTPALGMSAGMAASDAIIFGFQPMMGAH